MVIMYAVHSEDGWSILMCTLHTGIYMMYTLCRGQMWSTGWKQVIFL